MEPFNQLLSQYDIESLILVVILLLVGAKSLGEALVWLRKTTSVRFQKDFKTERVVEQHERFENKISSLLEETESLKECLHTVGTDLSSLSQEVKSIQDKLSTLENNQFDIREHFLYTIRVYIIEKYHYHCCVVQQIDEVTLDTLENQYTKYKELGGNSFIDGLMNKIRELPLAAEYLVDKDSRGDK